MLTSCLKYLIGMILIPLVILNQSFAQPALEFKSSDNLNFYEMKKNFNDYWNATENQGKKGWKQFQRWEYYWESRVNPDGSFPNGVDIWNEYIKYQNKSTQLTQGNDKIWSQTGPFKNPAAGNNQGGIGRINVVKIKPNAPKEIWIGSAAGGVWQSKDFGKTWNVFPFTQVLSMGISDIAFSESNPNVAYVATGDCDGTGTTYSTYSVGILKTTDGGNTWATTSFLFGPGNGKIVSKVVVLPNNPDIVIACTNDGIYKSIDGGKSWRNKISVSAYFRDIKIKRDDLNIILASTYNGNGNSALFRSIDAGETWVQAKSLSGITRTCIDFAYGNNDLVYMLCSTGSYFHSVQVSSDAGITWTIKSSLAGGTSNLMGSGQGTGNDKYYGQAWYDMALAVSPADDDVLYVGGINIWGSTNGGTSWSMTTHWYGGFSKPYVHADIHYLIFDLEDGFLLCGSDGGLDYANDPENSWINLNKGLSISQMYRVASAQTYTGLAYTGCQDNGTFRVKDGIWNQSYGGDGMDCVVNQLDYNKAIISMQNGDFLRTTNGVSFTEVLNSGITQEKGGWVTPIIMNPVNPNTVYTGYSNVWRSVDGGATWKKLGSLAIGTLQRLAMSPADTNTIYASNGSSIMVTYNNGVLWQPISNIPGSVQQIAVDPNNAKRIFIVTGGFSDGKKVFEYDGTNWRNLSGNLPNFPVNTIAYQKNSPDRLYVGTDIGVFYTDYNSGYWEPYGLGMPTVICSDLKIDYKGGKLVCGTYGRGLWSIDLNTCNLPQPDIQAPTKTKICEGDSVILTALTDAVVTWSTGETTKSIIVKTNGTYSFSIIGEGNCVVRSKAVILEKSIVPSLKISPIGKYPLCIGDSVNLELSASLGFSSYLWSTGESTRKIKVTLPGIYKVVTKTSSDCLAQSELEIKINPFPAKPIIYRLSGTELQSSLASTYQWYLNDTMLTNEIKRNIIIKTLGNYSVQITDSNSCPAKSDPLNITTDINDPNFETGITIHPNPTTGEVTVSIENTGNSKYRYSVSDLIGNEILSSNGQIIDQLFVVNLADKATGIYWLKIYFNDQVIVRKIFKR
jgi:photosystem II stability/assembly factor-like uncharacterized protein